MNWETEIKPFRQEMATILSLLVLVTAVSQQDRVTTPSHLVMGTSPFLLEMAIISYRRITAIILLLPVKVTTKFYYRMVITSYKLERVTISF